MNRKELLYARTANAVFSVLGLLALVVMFTFSFRNGFVTLAASVVGAILLVVKGFATEFGGSERKEGDEYRVVVGGAMFFAWAVLIGLLSFFSFSDVPFPAVLLVLMLVTMVHMGLHYFICWALGDTRWGEESIEEAAGYSPEA